MPKVTSTNKRKMLAGANATIANLRVQLTEAQMQLARARQQIEQLDDFGAVLIRTIDKLTAA